MSNEILKLENISMSYDGGKTFVLKNINFSLNKGEILSIIGVNGAGKTTLLKIIAGIIKQSSGVIIGNYKNLSYIPQKINIDNTFPITAKEFIEINNNKFEEKEIKNLASKLNILNLLDKKISTLSGGEFQKVLIISGLISKPDIILLDEPTAGVDIIGEQKFYEMINEVKDLYKNMSIIIVSHNINLVYKNSDKVICLHENNFCCHGTPTEIKNEEKIKEIFGELVLPYEHTPHEKH